MTEPQSDRTLNTTTHAVVDSADGVPRQGRASIAGKFARFLITGGLATVLQYILLIALVEGFSMLPTAASTTAYIVSSLFNYRLSHSFTFRSGSLHRHALPKFVMVAACGLALNAILMYIFEELYSVHYVIAQAIATCGTLLWNFSANLRWTFRSE